MAVGRGRKRGSRRRKIRISGQLRDFDELRTLKSTELQIGQVGEKDYKNLRWRYKKDGDVEFVEDDDNLADDDIVFGGSKSDIRRIEDLERNISVLATKLMTTDGGATDADDDNFGTVINKKTRFKDDVRFSGAVDFDDNIIVLNKDVGGTPSENAGIEIRRGTSTNAKLLWNETNDYWEIASGGTTGRILTTGDNISSDLVDDTTPQLGGDLYANGNQIIFNETDHTMAESLAFTGSNAGVVRSTISRHNILHDWQLSSHEGNIRIINYDDDKDIQLSTDPGDGGSPVVYLNCDGSTGEVSLRYYGSEKLATKSTGVAVTGAISGNRLTLNTADAPSDPSSGEAFIYTSKDSGNTGIRLHASGSSEVLEVRSGSSDTDLFKLNNQGNATFNGEVSASYFVDRNNTSYYLDPGSTTTSLNVAGNIVTTGKVLFANMYATEGDLPSATTYHGMFAHVHATGAGYFAHGGSWIKLANNSDIPTVPTNVSEFTNDAGYVTSTYANSNVDSHINVSGASGGQVLSWNGSDYEWVTRGTSNSDTTYSAGGGLNLSSETFSVNSNIRVNSSQYIGNDEGEHTYYSGNLIRFFIQGGEEFRMESDGDFHADGNLIAYSTTISDPRLKENITPVENALEKLEKLTGYTFDYKKDGKASAGVLSTEVEQVLPSAVQKTTLPLKADDDTEYDIVEYDQLTAILIEAVKELSARVKELENGSSK